jgi:hypothetical protein
MADISYAESIASRGGSEPEKRAELSDRLANAREALHDATTNHSEALICLLEGWPKEHDVPKLLSVCEVAQEEYRAALAAVRAFLGG